MSRCYAAWVPVLVLLSLSSAAGQTHHFYVAPNGNDAWSGERALADEGRTDGPFATLQRARDAIRELKRRQGGALRQPVTVFLRGGYYYLDEPLRLNALDGGTEQCPVVYAAFGDERPVLSGGRPIRGWKAVELDGKTVWAAELPEVREGKWFFHQLWVDGDRRPRARYPKRGYVRVVAVPDAPEEWREGGDRFRYREGDLGGWAVGGDTEVVVMNRWVESRLPVEHVDERERVVHFGKRSVFRLDPGDLYYVEHARSLLGAPGEWYLDRTAGVLYLVPLPGATPETIEAVAPVLEEVVRIEGAPADGEWIEHLTFRGLTFSHTEWYFPPGSTMEYLRPDRTLEEAPYLKPDVGGCHQAAARVPAAVAVSGARGVTFEGCRFVHLGGYGVALESGCRHNRIAGCEMTDLGAGGVKIGETLLRETVAEQTFGNEVVDCHIHNVGRLFHSAVGVWVGQSYDNRLAHNRIHDLYYSAISIGWTWGYGKTLARGNIVEYNHVHHLGGLSSGDGPILSDMGAVYTVGVQPGTAIRHNFFHDIAGRSYGGWGVYLDEGSSHILVENNLVTRTAHGGFHQHFGRDNLIRNNIFAFGRHVQLQRTRAEAQQNLTFERNIVYWSEGSLFGRPMKDFQFSFDRNLYWSTAAGPIDFDGLSFEQWQAQGMDRHSRIADPFFIAPHKDDFRLGPDSPALALGFEPFDATNVGPRFPPGQPQ